MAIAHDAATRWPGSGFDNTAGDRTFSHTPSGTPVAVAVLLVADETTDPLTTAYYGNSPMDYTQGATDTTGGTCVRLYTLASNVPSGQQTITLFGCDAIDKFAYCVTCTSATGAAAVEDSRVADTQGPGANPSISLVCTNSSMCYAAFGSGYRNAPIAYSGTTLLGSSDFGNETAAVTAKGVVSGTVTQQVTQNSDYWCAAAVGFREATGATAKSDSDAGTATEAGVVSFVQVGTADAARASEAAASTATLSAADAARAAEVSAVVAFLAGTDAARAAEAASVTETAFPSGTDAARASEAASSTATLAGTDAAAAAENAAVTAYPAGADAARAAEAGSVAETAYPSGTDAARAAEAAQVAASIAAADAAAVTEAAVIGLVYLADTESAAAAEAGSVLGATQYVTSAGTARVAETASTVAPYADAEAARVAEAQTVLATLGSPEAGLAAEAAAVAAGLASADVALAAEGAATTAYPVSADWSAASEAATASASLAAAEAASATEAAQVSSVSTAEAVRVTDAGESGTGAAVTKASSDSAQAAEVQALTARLPDADWVSGAETGQFRTLSAADAGQLRDAGETATSLHLDSDQAFASEQQAIRAALADSDLDKATDNSEQVSGVSAAEATRVADNQAVTSLVSSAESCVASESAPPARATLTSADSAEAADVQQITASLADAEAATVASAASPALAGVVSADAAVVNVAASVPFAQVTSAETVRATDAGESGTGGAAPRYDTETIHVVDSDITYYASADSAAVADAGERIRATKVRDTDRVRVTDAVGPPGGTWLIFSAERVRAADAGCWSGPLASADAVRVTDDEEDIAPWTLTDDDYVTATDDLPPLHVYAYALAPGGLLLRGVRIVLEGPESFEPISPVKPTVTAHVTLVISPALNVTFDAVRSGAYNGGIESGG